MLRSGLGGSSGMHVFSKLRLALIVACLGVGLLPAMTSAASKGALSSPNTEAVSFNPGMGPVGTAVTIAGTGWRQERGRTVSLTMCTPGAPVVATTVVSRDGTFTFGAVTIPSVGLYSMYDANHCVFSISAGD